MSPMSRVKSRPSSDVCGDCGAPDPTWVSANRAILLCLECCSVHRNLGRHVSQIKSLHRSQWISTQLAMVLSLNSSGVNSIWEHTLSESAKPSFKKPQPKDPLHPTKAEFIRAKHGRLAWVIAPDGSREELGQQLHASARSSNLHTSIRLLAQGADPNYFHNEKGSTPLHVAAKSNQISQAELLLVYGADPRIPDRSDKTAAEVANQAGYTQLAERLSEANFELTDRLSIFLCGRRPDHRAGQHLLVPDIKEADVIAAPAGRPALQALSNRLFEEFAKDIYDEVDRREIETIWVKTPGALSCRGGVPFLPVCPEYSTTRNQARQKLARLEDKEFNAVVLDVLVDARRRQLSARFSHERNSRNADINKHISQISDDEPLYDSVASDDDYAALTPLKKSDEGQRISQPTAFSNNHVSDQQTVEKLAEKLRRSDGMVAELRAEVGTLRTLLERLSLENCDLRTKLNGRPCEVTSSSGFNSIGDMSMLSSSRHLMESTLLEQKADTSKNSSPQSNGQVTMDDMEPVQDIRPRSGQRPASMYETRERDWQYQRDVSGGMTQSLYQCRATTTTPSQSVADEISRRTNQVTRRIQELWGCIQAEGQRKDCAVPCAERIRVAVAELTAVVPHVGGDSGEIRQLIRQLVVGTARLQVECAGLQRASALPDPAQTATYLHLVRACAYDIAKATKLLFEKFQNIGGTQQ